MYTFLSDRDKFRIRCRVTSSLAKSMERGEAERNNGRYYFPHNLVYDLFCMKGIKPISEVCGILDRPEAIPQMMTIGLSSTEQEVLAMLYMQDMSLEDASIFLGIACEPISIIRDNALGKIWIQLM